MPATFIMKGNTMAGFFKTGLPSILRKNEAEKPDTEGTALARHFSPAVERHLPPPPREPVAAPPPVAKPAPPPKPAPRPMAVLALDLTASREAAQQTAIPLTDAILAALPGQLDVALAAHGGERVHTFTAFTSNANKLRDAAASIRCLAGETRMLPILARVLRIKDVSTVVYIGDVFEESERQGRKYADALKAHGTRLIILHDCWPGTFSNEKGIFAEMAARSGGTILPFEASSLPKLKELLSAIAVLAVGDVTALAAKEETMPGARLLLEGLADSRQLLIGGKGGAR
jgi:hypothetical protein